MSWTIDRGIHGIICFVCRGRGKMMGLQLATGAQQVIDCRDCGGTGFVKHCVGCNGTGRVDSGTAMPLVGVAGDGIIDCPECNGKGYPLPKRIFV